MIDIDKAISTAVKTGRVLFGANNALKSAKLGRAKIIIAASNCQRNIIEDITYYARISDVSVVIYKSSSIDLGITCGKPFMVSVLTIRETGDSDIIQLTEKTKEFVEESKIEAVEKNNA
jgi:large subunit ribosomal protein L30e